MQWTWPMYFAYKAVTTTYSVGPKDVTVDCTTGTFTVTLPTAVGVSGKMLNVKNSGGGVITAVVIGGQTIDGSSSQKIFSQESMFVQSNGANWIII